MYRPRPAHSAATCCVHRRRVDDALPAILSELLAADTAARPIRSASAKPHVSGEGEAASSFCFHTGGVSHMDTFDHKPKLFAADGKTPRASAAACHGKKRPLLRDDGQRPLPARPRLHGRHLPDPLDARPTTTSTSRPRSAMHTGSFTFARPSIGSWVSYGLGTVNRNLPSFVVLAPQLPYAGSQVVGDRLPARLPPGHARRAGPGADPQHRRAARRRTAGTGTRPARAVQPPAPERTAPTRRWRPASSRSRPPSACRPRRPKRSTCRARPTRRSRSTASIAASTQGFAWQCLVARRLAERGVRFIELIDTGSSNNWDAHGDMADHAPLARNVDQPIAGLLRDLKRRGMLDDTLVVWTTEFGRTPFNRRTEGPRTSPRWAFRRGWPAAASKAASSTARPTSTAATVAEDRVHVHDFHATILHLLGFDHEKLTYRHAGRDFRLTDARRHRGRTRRRPGAKSARTGTPCRQMRTRPH